MSLVGKRAVITGAAGSIGSAVAKRYAQEGIQLVLIDKTVHALETLDDALADFGIETTLVPLDLADTGKVENLGVALAERFGHIDILVSCAAVVGMLAPIHSVCTDVWQSTLQTNVTANFALIKALEPLLKRAEQPRAIFVTSSIAQELTPYWAPYAVSKAALESLVILWSKEVKNTIPDLQISLLDPGKVNTPSRAALFPGQDLSGLPTPENIADLFIEKLAYPKKAQNKEAPKVA